MGDQYCLEELGGGEEGEPGGQASFEDDLDAFNDETFGGGDTWVEGDHEQLAEMTEKEKLAMLASNQFFQFGSDGEELGGELEELVVQPQPQVDGLKMGRMQLKDGAAPPAAHQQQPPLQQQQVVPLTAGLLGGHQPGGASLQPHYPLLPPSHFGGGESLAKLPPPLPPFPGGVSPYPGFPGMPGLPPHQQHQGGRGGGGGVVPGMKTLADLEAEMLFGARPPVMHQQQPPPLQHRLPPQVVPGGGGQMGHLNPVLPRPPQTKPKAVVGGGGQVGHINPAMHNLSYPDMRDRHGQPLQQPGQQLHLARQQVARQSPVQVAGVRQQGGRVGQGHHHHHPGLQLEQGEFQGDKRDFNYNDKRINAPQQRFDQHQQINQQQYLQHQHHHQQPPQLHQHQHHQQQQHQHQHNQDRRNHFFNDSHRGGGGGGPSRQDNGFNNRQRRDSWRSEKSDHYDNKNRHNRNTFGEYFEQSARRDLMPGHVHTLGILRHSRSRHERERSDSGGLEDCLEEGNSVLLANPTGDPVLDAKMAEEQAEMAKKRAHYASTEDEYAGLMSQKDKQWIINIQLNQLKCDNPYVDDYYYTMIQHKKVSATTEVPAAGGQLIKSVSESGGSNQDYKPAQFENSLGKLQVVTVKAPRLMLDIGVVRGGVESPVSLDESLDTSLNTSTASHKAKTDLKGVLLHLETLYLALLELECDDLKLAALPEKALLMPQVVESKELHLQTLQAGLSHSNWLVDCLAVSKGRKLLLRCLPFLPGGEGGLRSALLDLLLSHLHLLAREPGEWGKVWGGALLPHINTHHLPSLDQCARSLLCLKPKHLAPLLATSLGASSAMALLARAAREHTGPSATWSKLATALMQGGADLPPLLPLDREEIQNLGMIMEGQERQQEWNQFLNMTQAKLSS